MRNIFLFGLFFSFTVLLSQNFVFEYEEKFYDGDRSVINNTFLIGNDKEIFYFNYNNDKLISLEEAFENYTTNKSPIKIRFSLVEKKIYDYRYFPENFYIGLEDLPHISWLIGKETKIILGYLCYNATTTFRGRKYMAWFAKEIPISYGPWKFNGLPGLILEIQDSENYFSYGIKSINLESRLQVPAKLSSFFYENSKNYIPYHELFNKETNFLLDLRSKVRSNAPSGTNFIDSDIRIFLKEKILVLP